MDKKLSVLQRESNKTGWDKSNQFSSGDVKNIKVFTARRDKSLNAIPSPLARIHLFEAAFDLLHKDELNKTNYSGDTYRKIVSDCFDVFELVYNWNNHIREGKKLSIVKWNVEKEIELLKKGKKRHQLLAETLEVFFQDESYQNFQELLIFKLNNVVIAGSSPFTGFFTAPNDLSNVNLFNSLNKRNYFTKIIPFSERKPEIKSFIYNFFFKGSLSKLKSTDIIRNYLMSYEHEIDSTVNLPLEKINDSTDSLFGQPLRSSSRKTESDYFEKYLVKINYRINDECFLTPSNDRTDRNHDYLLPFSSDFFQEFNFNEIPQIVKIKEFDDKTVEVSITRKEDNKIFSKKYQAVKNREEDGQIIDLDDTYSIKINIGIFPFLKVSDGLDQNTTSPGFNDFYKVMFVCQDNTDLYSNSDFKLSFSINKTLISPPTASNYISSVDHRTVGGRDKSIAGSTYYSLKGRNGESVCFDYIQLQLPRLSNEEVRCVVVPKWREKAVGTKQIDYAVDFGTTTTFISYTDDPYHQTSPKPFSLGVDTSENERDIIVQLLNRPKKKDAQFQWIDCFEKSLSDFQESIEVQKQEFMPSLINNEKYKVPFRTVVYQKKSIPEKQKKLFSNINISFTYQKEDNNATHLNQEFVTNLKWNVNTDKSFEESIEIFIEQVFYLLRFKTILRDGDPQKTRISWFSPLSFTPDAQRGYEKIWADKFKEVFKGNSQVQLNNITESEAPFYYYSKDASISNASSVLTLDIGGGTTDIMYIVNNRPALCTSVHFGANVLWGNGFNEFKNIKDNGIYQAVKDVIISRLRSTELKALNEKFTSNESPFGSDEIINFWISNNEQTDVIRELDKGSFRLAYLLHLTSLIYHSFTILKQHGQRAPTCIIFSGNGSKYLDLIQSTSYIEKICAYIAQCIFTDKSSIPQIILPNNNRKEATCFGGLYRPFNQTKTYKPVNYLGFEDQSQPFTKYSEIDVKKEFVLGELSKSFGEFIECFFKMNDNIDLSFRNVFGIDSNLTAIKNYLKSKASENLVAGYDKRRMKVGDNDPITDSLFFYPLIGLIYKLNKLTPDELHQFIPKTSIYAVSPESDKGFLVDKITIEPRPDSIYKITIEDSYPNVGSLTILGDASVHKRALSSVEGYLKPVCSWSEYFSTPDQTIKIIKPGRVIKEDGYWVIKEKMEIEFV